jgi:predicted transcriptional regulator
MEASVPAALSRRERQIMDIVYHRGRATAAEVLDDLADPPSYNAVRSALRLLEEKGHLRHEEDGRRYVYLPTTPRTRARTHALQHLLRTFFGGSAEQVVNALLDETKLSKAELERMAQRIREAHADEEEEAR